jgi:hypothetical protein
MDITYDRMMRATLRCKFYGGTPSLADYEIEHDKRRFPKKLRELTEQGYITKEGGKLLVTTKVYDEYTPCKPDLEGRWNHSRKNWNRESMPWVLVDDMEPAEQKHLIENAKDYRFLLVYDQPIRYSAYKFETDHIVGPIPLEQIGDKYRELFAKSRAEHRHSSNDWLLAVQTDQLVEHCNKIVKEERFQSLYSRNLKWGFVQLGVLDEEDAKHIYSEDSVDFINPFGNLGTEPDKWNDEAIQFRVEGIKNTIKTHQQRLDVMMRLISKVQEMGGWDEFKRRYAERLQQQIDKTSCNA